ncbi:hypothetical protein WN53_00165 [Serratia fonticola]|jgi:hypothetical protein|uniref:Uncharacterized protein n=2 Tax=Serratia fonticola TaxID=47917 RepID=A0A0F7H6Y3_SERFO|nr:hypothetical protein WN53_00165 [Serratia fonticola]CAI0868259.1 Uncharacterised protein [Serratia fonticola]CAI0921036.1 Uncharacterised protein [Serratia fonticola]CAI1818430.1 Uncharacterised protein [Serratia fonticola]VEI73674.1 Uncharacterised protein [Serratia fonticola]
MEVCHWFIFVLINDVIKRFNTRTTAQLYDSLCQFKVTWFFVNDFIFLFHYTNLNYNKIMRENKMKERTVVSNNGFSYKELLKFKKDYLAYKKELKRLGEEDSRKMSFVDSIVVVSKESAKTIFTLVTISILYVIGTVFFDIKETLFAVPFFAAFILWEIYNNAKKDNHSIITELKLIKLGLKIKINQFS